MFMKIEMQNTKYMLNRSQFLFTLCGTLFMISSKLLYPSQVHCNKLGQWSKSDIRAKMISGAIYMEMWVHKVDCIMSPFVWCLVVYYISVDLSHLSNIWLEE